MGIEKIKGNVEGCSGQKCAEGKALKNRVFLTQPKDSVNFTSAMKLPEKTLKDVLLELMPRKINWMVKAHKGMGEIQNQMINAAGTGLVAPVFIKYNPLSKTDEDKRTYTAWRQPVSAVLALGTQCAIVIPFNKAIKNMSDIGYEHFALRNNSSLFPSDDYIKKGIRAENKGVKFTKDEMKAQIEEVKKGYDKALREMIDEDRIVFKQTGVNGEKFVEMPKEEFKSLFEETLDVIIDEEIVEKQKLLEVKHAKKSLRSVFFREHPVESRKLLNDLHKALNDVNGSNLHNAKDVDPKVACKRFNKECKRIISELKTDSKQNPSKAKVNKELIEIVNDVQRRNIPNPATNRALIYKVEKMQHSLETVAKMKSTREVMEYTNNLVCKRLDAIDGLIGLLTDIKMKLNSSGITVAEAKAMIADRIETAKAQLQERLILDKVKQGSVEDAVERTENISTRLTNKLGNLSDNIGAQLKKHVSSNIDGLKRWTGLTVSLAILPATCWMLNEIYPWFMDRCFPELSKKNDKAKEQPEKKDEVA